MTDNVQTVVGDRITVIGDPHLNSTRPISRIDDYPAASIEKLAQIRDAMIACDSKVAVILGDVWHKREQSFQYLCGVCDVLKSFADAGILVTTIVGNHDIAYEQMGTLDQRPLGLLFKTGLIKHLSRLDLVIPKEAESRSMSPRSRSSTSATSATVLPSL